MGAIPPAFAEVSSGILVVIVFWMILFNLQYLWHQYNRHQSLFRMREETKAAFALLTIFVGLEVRTMTVWWFNHVESRHGDVSQFAPFGIVAVLVGTILGIWGGLCWIKVVTPVRLSSSSWLFIGATAIAAALWSALT